MLVTVTTNNNNDNKIKIKISYIAKNLLIKCRILIQYRNGLDNCIKIIKKLNKLCVCVRKMVTT